MRWMWCRAGLQATCSSYRYIVHTGTFILVPMPNIDLVTSSVVVSSR